MSHTQLVISPKLKHNFDRYIRFVNIVNDVLFAETLIELGLANILGKPLQLYMLLKYIMETCFNSVLVSNQVRLILGVLN